MLTFRAVSAKARASAVALAAHFTEQTLPADRQALARYYAGGIEPTEANARMGTLPEPRRDMHPAVAAALGLDPTRIPTEAEIVALFQGMRADGTELPKAPGRPREIGFVDMCLSADKSVSLAWAFAPTEAERAMIFQAHLDAVQSTLHYIESQVARATVMVNGQREKHPAHMGWLSFHHFTARPTVEVVRADPKTGVMATELYTVRRAGDPQLHTHTAVPNFVVTPDGKVGSLDTLQMQGRIKEFGALYQAFLATNLRQAGVQGVVLDRENGAARIECIPETARKEFSRRTLDAEGAAREMAAKEGKDWDSMTPDQRVKLLKGGAKASRRSKADDLSDFGAWAAQAEQIGWKHHGILTYGPPPPPLTRAERLERAYQVFLDLFEKDLEHRSVVERATPRVAAARGLIDAGIEDAADLNAITRAARERGVRQDGQATEVLWVRDSDQAVHVTTRLHVEQERRFIELVKGAAADQAGALTRAEIDAAIQRLGMRFEGDHGAKQLDMAYRLGTGGQFSFGIGAAGAGKTTLLAPLVDAHRAKGRDVYGTALGWEQANKLAEAGVSRMRTYALDPLLAKLDDGSLKLGPKSVLLVDEVASLGVRQMLKLLEHRAAMGFRIATVGDPEQWKGMHAGNVAYLMTRALGEENVPVIATTIRQRHERERHIAGLFREGRLVEALDMKREDGTAEVVLGGRKEIIARAVELWQERTRANHNTPGYSLTVMAPTNADAMAIAQAIREKRREAGELGADAVSIKTGARGFDMGTLVLAPGDRIRLYRRVFGQAPDGKMRHIGNNQSVVAVVRATTEGAVLRGADGNEGWVPWSKLQARGEDYVEISYGDVRTIHALQGDTSTEAIWTLPGGSRGIDKALAYVGNTRHRGEKARPGGNWLLTSDGAERQEIMSRRPAGDPRPITAEDVWANIARNLGRQTEKASALAFVEQARDVLQGAVRGLQAALWPAESQRARGQQPPSVAQRARDRADEQAVAEALPALRQAVERRGRRIEALARSPKAVQPEQERQDPRSGIVLTPQPGDASMGHYAAHRFTRPPSPPRHSVAGLQEAELRLLRKAHVEQVRLALVSRTDDVVQLLFAGEAIQRGGAEWRVGRKGSLSVEVKGAKRGMWFDHEAGKGGDLLDLIRHRLGTSFPDALAWGRDLVGIPAPENGKRLTADERVRLAISLQRAQERHAAQAAEAERHRLERRETVARRAAIAWAGSKPAPADHPYLVRKGISPEGLRVDRIGRLRTPLQDQAGKVWSLQHIDAEGNKRFLRGGRVDGCFTVIGPTDPRLPRQFAEGVATGKSLLAFNNLPTVITYNVNNKEKVVREWRERNPDQVLIDAADNDHHKPRVGKRNAGLDMARRLARDYGALPVLPPFNENDQGTDWNDYARKYGNERAAAAFQRAAERGPELVGKIRAEASAEQEQARRREDRDGPGMER